IRKTIAQVVDVGVSVMPSFPKEARIEQCTVRIEGRLDEIERRGVQWLLEAVPDSERNPGRSAIAVEAALVAWTIVVSRVAVVAIIAVLAVATPERTDV